MVEPILVHERVGLGVDAGTGEEVLNVSQPAHAFVEEVLALARPVEAPGNAHFAPRNIEPAVIVEDEADLRQTHRSAGGRAVEDHVLHLLSAQCLWALLAEGPPNRVRDIRLAAAVWPDDAGDAGEDLDLGLLGKRLEALDDDLF